MTYEEQDSILATVKKMLGIDDDYSVFDMDVIVLINSALMTLQQLGVGPKEGFVVRDYTQNWHQFLTNEVKLEAAKQYVYLKVKTIFDPPSSGTVMEAYNRQIAELEWRLNVQAESVETFDFVEKDKKKTNGYCIQQAVSSGYCIQPDNGSEQGSSVNSGGTSTSGNGTGSGLSVNGRETVTPENGSSDETANNDPEDISGLVISSILLPGMTSGTSGQSSQGISTNTDNSGIGTLANTRRILW